MAKNEKKCHFGIDITSEVRNIFGDDWTTKPKFCLIKVQLADFAEDESTLAGVAAKALTTAEMTTFQTFRFLHRKREWLAGRLAVKEAVMHLLGEPQRCRHDIAVGADDKGKPFLATTLDTGRAVHLAISHSGGIALGLASFSPCAIDVQEIRSSLARVEAKFAQAEEAALLNPGYADKLTALGLLWAGKEALRKYVALWPLLGFMESDLQGVAASGNGFLLSFLPKEDKRSLPDRLPEVWAAMFEKNALAIILCEDESG